MHPTTVRLIGKIRYEKNEDEFFQIGTIVYHENYIAFNPEWSEVPQLHSTLHKDGMMWWKDGETGEVKDKFERQPLDDFSGTMQFIHFIFFPKNCKSINKPYRTGTAQTRAPIDIILDLENMEGQVSCSIHLADANNLEKCVGFFNTKKKHKCYAFTEREPFLVVHLW